MVTRGGIGPQHDLIASKSGRIGGGGVKDTRGKIIIEFQSRIQSINMQHYSSFKRIECNVTGTPGHEYGI